MWTRRGHKECTSTGTDARIDGMVKVRVRHIIDRGGGGEGAQSARHLVLVLVFVMTIRLGLLFFSLLSIPPSLTVTPKL